MISKRVTAVSLTRTTDAGGGLTSHVGTELWLVEWTISASNGKTEHLRHSHYTEKSARRLVENLLNERPDDKSLEDVYRET